LKETLKGHLVQPFVGKGASVRLFSTLSSRVLKTFRHLRAEPLCFLENLDIAEVEAGCETQVF